MQQVNNERLTRSSHQLMCCAVSIRPDTPNRNHAYTVGICACTYVSVGVHVCTVCVCGACMCMRVLD